MTCSKKYHEQKNIGCGLTLAAFFILQKDFRVIKYVDRILPRKESAHG